MATLRIIDNTVKCSNDKKFTTVENEWNQFKMAQEKAIKELNDLSIKLSKEGNSEFASLFETHALMAEDPDFEDAVREGIEELTLDVSSAVLKAGEKLAMFFESMDDDYMSQRGADVKDVANRIATLLSSDSTQTLSFSSPVILAADDLTPSQTISLDKKYVKGFILYNGTENGHTGILARNLGIPAVIHPSESFSLDDDSKLVFINGKTGEIILEPDDETKDKCNEYITNQLNEQNDLLKYRDMPTKTSSGKSIKLYCNIGSPKDTIQVIENGGEGVGLFRSEFLYLNCDDYPSEEEQFESYVQTLKDLQDKEVIIRTCDIGSDKRIDYFSLPSEQNPALGTRAIRICLERKEMFKTQLRALYRASVYGKLSIMFPMITSVWELEEIKAIIEEVKVELNGENIEYSNDVKIGVMIETPAAAIISDKLAQLVDFFSIGSNDLTQYTLACDRNSDLGRYFDPRHLAVLRLIKMVANNAHNEGIQVGICGELASDEELTEFFLDIGIDELSVSPTKVLSLRKFINQL